MVTLLTPFIVFKLALDKNIAKTVLSLCFYLKQWNLSIPNIEYQQSEQASLTELTQKNMTYDV